MIVLISSRGCDMLCKRKFKEYDQDFNSQNILRKVLGILGIALPFLCIIGGYFFADSAIKNSISAYYHSNMQDIFVGILICYGLFLLTYRGYDIRDNLLSSVTGIFAILIALFPCTDCIKDPTGLYGVFQVSPEVSDIFHVISAVSFFSLLAYISICLFTMSNKEQLSKQKKKRNLVYKICGYTIIGVIAISLIVMIIDKPFLKESTFVFFAETIMLLAFGTSWLVKGDTLFRD